MLTVNKKGTGILSSLINTLPFEAPIPESKEENKNYIVTPYFKIERNLLPRAFGLSRNIWSTYKILISSLRKYANQQLPN